MYRPARVEVSYRAKDRGIDDYFVRDSLQRAILKVVTDEGPISRELLLQRIRVAWGYGRAGSRIRDTVFGALGSLVRSGDIVSVDKGFVAVDAESSGPVRVALAGESDTQRDPEDVPPSELRQAALYLVADSLQVSWDQLTAAVARLFGWGRRGQRVSAVLNRTVNKLVRDKLLVKQGDMLSLSGAGENDAQQRNEFPECDEGPEPTAEWRPAPESTQRRPATRSGTSEGSGSMRVGRRTKSPQHAGRTTKTSGDGKSERVNVNDLLGRDRSQTSLLDDLGEDTYLGASLDQNLDDHAFDNAELPETPVGLDPSELRELGLDSKETDDGADDYGSSEW